jgi:hypothetical protein
VCVCVRVCVCACVWRGGGGGGALEFARGCACASPADSHTACRRRGALTVARCPLNTPAHPHAHLIISSVCPRWCRHASKRRRSPGSPVAHSAAHTTSAHCSVNSPASSRAAASSSASTSSASSAASSASLASAAATASSYLCVCVWGGGVYGRAGMGVR